jgi:hypothetical protein
MCNTKFGTTTTYVGRRILSTDGARIMYCLLNSIKEEARIPASQISRFNYAVMVMTTTGGRNAITSWIIPVNFMARTWRPVAYLPVRLRDIGMWWSDAEWLRRFERIFMVNFTLDNEVNTLIRNVGNHSANDTVSFLVNDQRDAQLFTMYLFLFLTLYMFWAHRAHHQERQIVSTQPSDLHTTRPPTQTDSNQRLSWHNLSLLMMNTMCSKHVEI